MRASSKNVQDFHSTQSTIGSLLPTARVARMRRWGGSTVGSTGQGYEEFFVALAGEHCFTLRTSIHGRHFGSRSSSPGVCSAGRLNLRWEAWLSVPRQFETNLPNGKNVELRPTGLERTGRAWHREINGCGVVSRNLEVLCYPDACDAHVAIVLWIRGPHVEF